MIGYTLKITSPNIEAFLDKQERSALLTMIDIVGLVKIRTQLTGVNSEGELYEEYTEDYAEDRDADGYQTDYVDFTKTGSLWAGIFPEVLSSDGATIVIEAKPRDRFNQAKLNGQFKKRGNILIPSETEMGQAQAAYRQRRQNDLNNS